ncbi:glucose dehydrogenase [Inhella inkyongensis]|uniref:Glucose dehydrogenase n=1 Tax=Inhella inkyongensis TaxID=392593 RepID=A0A840S9U7_9BURK|nr:hypothetical protein [Inhella inkyongensis]MBB5205179.1 glucose dehydrogenase [Inhella inkyongensis]
MRSTLLLLALALLSPAAQAHGGSDWMLAVSASYSAVLVGGACGVWAAWRQGVNLWRLLPPYALALAALAVWMNTQDWPFAAGLIAIACVLLAGAFFTTRWLTRLLRRRS